VVVSEETKIQQPGYPSNPTEMKKERTGFFGRKKKQEAIIPVTQTDQQEAYPAAQIKEKKGTWNLLRKKKEKLPNTPEATKAYQEPSAHPLPIKKNLGIFRGIFKKKQKEPLAAETPITTKSMIEVEDPGTPNDQEGDHQKDDIVTRLIERAEFLALTLHEELNQLAARAENLDKEFEMMNKASLENPSPSKVNKKPAVVEQPKEKESGTASSSASARRLQPPCKAASAPLKGGFDPLARRLRPPCKVNKASLENPSPSKANKKPAVVEQPKEKESGTASSSANASKKTSRWKRLKRWIVNHSDFAYGVLCYAQYASAILGFVSLFVIGVYAFFIPIAVVFISFAAMTAMSLLGG